MSTQSRSFSDSVYRPGEPVLVTIHIEPNQDTLAYAVEETFPAGWTASNLNLSGNNVGGKCKWGVFFDGQTRDFTYQATPPAGSSAVGSFVGVASFDGSSVSIGGLGSLEKDSIAPLPPS